MIRVNAAREQAALVALDTGDVTADLATGVVTDRTGARLDRPTSSGYRQVYLAGKNLGFAHRLVWMAAHGQIPPGLYINHKDRDRQNNALPNLELVTPLGNSRHAMGLHYDHVPAVGAGDLGAVSREWLAQVQALVASGNATREDIDRLRGDAACEDRCAQANGSVIHARGRMKRFR